MFLGLTQGSEEDRRLDLHEYLFNQEDNFATCKVILFLNEQISD